MNIKPLLLALACLAVILPPRPLEAQSLDEARRLLQEGEIAGAVAVFRQVAVDSEDTAERATAFNNACVLEVRLGRYAAAFEDCRQALPLRRQQGDAKRLARSLNNTGLALQHLARYDDAIPLYEEALQINRRLEDWHSVAINLSNLGFLLTTVGNFEAASRRLTTALDLAAAHGGEPWAEEQQLVARVNYGVLLENVGAYREALDLYDDILLQAASLEAGRRAQLEVNRGVMLRNLGDPVRAQSAFEQAVEVLAQSGDPAGLSNAWLNLGLVRFLDLAQLERAEEALRQAAEQAERSGDVEAQAQSLYFLGRLYIEQGKYQAAADGLDICRQLLTRGTGPEDRPRDGSQIPGFWRVEEGTARLAWARGDLRAALGAFQRALGHIESTRENLHRATWRAGYLEDKRSIYVAAVEVAVQVPSDQRSSGRPERPRREAWEVVQRAKARQLLESLGATSPQPVTATTEHSLEDLVDALGDDVLLELFVGGSRLHAWTLVAGELRWHDLGPPAPLLDAARRVHGALSRSEVPPEGDLASLSAALLAGTGILEGGARHLFVVADGELRRLPFELLSSSGRRLIDSMAVSYLPNASMLAPLRRRQAAPQAPGNLRLLAIGAPEISPREDRLAGLADLMRQRFQLADLPAAASELSMVAETLQGQSTVLSGSAATEAALRHWAPQGQGVLHFATHTLVDDGPGGTSAVVLTPADEDDGMLMPREIANLPLRASLTVLASCRSGLGDIDGNGALSSLSGAFLAAGSSAVVASLWDVDDQATAVFMQQLYYQLAQGLTPHEALRQAKLQLHQDPRWNRPHVWGAFVLIGAAPPVMARPGSWLLGGLVILALTGSFILWRRRRALGPMDGH